MAGGVSTAADTVPFISEALANTNIHCMERTTSVDAPFILVINPWKCILENADEDIKESGNQRKLNTYLLELLLWQAVEWGIVNRPSSPLLALKPYFIKISSYWTSFVLWRRQDYFDSFTHDRLMQTNFSEPCIK